MLTVEFNKITDFVLFVLLTNTNLLFQTYCINSKYYVIIHL